LCCFLLIESFTFLSRKGPHKGPAEAAVCCAAVSCSADLFADGGDGSAWDWLIRPLPHVSTTLPHKRLIRRPARFFIAAAAAAAVFAGGGGGSACDWLTHPLPHARTTLPHNRLNRRRHYFSLLLLLGAAAAAADACC
jgi:hypothetical protein